MNHCVKANAPVDFVSTHVYANDTAKDVFGTNEVIPRSEMVARSVRKVYDQVKASARPDLPIIWSEYNASYMNEVAVTDSPFMGPWLANNIRQCDGRATIMSYWAFSDVFEEQGVVKTPFYGGYGLIAAGHIPKAAFNAFKMLHLLGEQRIVSDAPDALATKRADGTVVVAVWNYVPPEEAGSPKRIALDLRNLDRARRLRIHVLDAAHGSALTVWEKMGRPSFPTREQQRQLQRAAELPAPEERKIPAGKSGSLTIDLSPHGLAVIEILK